jgi:hypothetical protein
MASALASRLERLEAEIAPPSKVKVVGSFISAEEFAERQKGNNVLAQGECWIITISDDDED